ncbi:FTR1 family protein [Aliiglaciecola sp. CAU 1673]|uniref:FTR1 family protein n=1 Tax=Aliiglaciecola sp. CAU 1673 TaxID=3032595 RepID=UPI0023DA184E|nr:FTR1 family protein [Aliiglaciecola sp. CAU 1673]MDF2176718.1 FTR1 family protein [Aliiglaciecola sp. CAU 1673]
MNRVITKLLLIATMLLPIGLHAAQQGPERILHLLAYVGVDYPMTVADGRVVDEGEYAEQVEFARVAEEILLQLPRVDTSDTLLNQINTLQLAIAQKQQGSDIKALTGEISKTLTQAYNIKLSPRKAPRPDSVAQLYQAQCAMCHGSTGLGDGIAGQGMEPAPANFHDRERMSELSLFGLYNTITLGVEGTGMASYAQSLNDDQRWALAAFVAGYVTDTPVDAVASPFSLDELATMTPNQVAADGRDVDAFVQLRAHPDQILSSGPDPLAFAQMTLQKSWQAAEAGDRELAYELSINAYLEGFELTESGLRNLDAPLTRHIEKSMFAYRDGLRSGLPQAQLESLYQAAMQGLEQAALSLGQGELSPWLSFVASLIILLREGLEAILVLAAIFAFLSRAGATQSLKYVHGGWMAALGLGLVTWLVASFVLDISGASREITEGVAALVAMVVLLWVGIWMHSKAHANSWQDYIKQKLSASLSSGQNWGFALLAFIAVYREIFEIVLFYQTLWLQAGETGHSAVLWGVLVALVGLGLLGWAIFKAAMRLPVAGFFKVNAVIMFVLALIFAGRGIAALQEMGALASKPLNMPSVEWLGLYADGMTLATQGAILALIALMVWLQRKPQ